jgi:hypothetical protein
MRNRSNMGEIRELLEPAVAVLESVCRAKEGELIADFFQDALLYNGVVVASRDDLGDKVSARAIIDRIKAIIEQSPGEPMEYAS